MKKMKLYRHILVTPALRRLRQEDHKIGATWEPMKGKRKKVRETETKTRGREKQT